MLLLSRRDLEQLGALLLLLRHQLFVLRLLPRLHREEHELDALEAVVERGVARLGVRHRQVGLHRFLELAADERAGGLRVELGGEGRH
ncbi:hypothetical protein AB1Y20_009831 [Prymnesium parvum]|uniref:Secreted protein n=1 Tax=Prymnesium parvum TaxID=97485 RepID=A0AB34K5D4_PRYPA